MAKSKQLTLLKCESSRYGGDLYKTRKGRARPRPLAVKSSMHLVMRSKMAKGDYSFRRPQHLRRIEQIVRKFATKHGVGVHSMANVGNHLHFHIRLQRRGSYRPFIRAISAAIAMAVTGVNRWHNQGLLKKQRFWDGRPFTRILNGFRDFLSLKDYIEINQLEGFGNSRASAREIIADWKGRKPTPYFVL